MPWPTRWSTAPDSVRRAHARLLSQSAASSAHAPIMPIYVYEIVNEDGTPGEKFELLQGITDPPLKKHPETGRPVRRVVCAPHVPGRYRPTFSDTNISDKNLDRLGFTKYVKKDEGTYEKRAGGGPDYLERD